MTMFPTHNLSKHGGGGGGCGGRYSETFGLTSRLEGYETCGGDLLLRSDRMAEDESRTESVNEEASSSKDVQEERDEGWLQLGIGGPTNNQSNQLDQVRPTERKSAGLVELDLLRSSPPVLHVPEFRLPPRPVSNTTIATSSMFPYYHQEINWAFRPIPGNIAVAASASTSSSSSSYSSSSLSAPGSYFTGPFQVQAGVDFTVGPSLDFRVIDPPRRHHSGVWFMLQASKNQAKEPFLPQIPKSYLRIKDGRMTVRLLMKYLVNKLRLDSESEIDITCRGQQLLPFLTLQHVRDNIWGRREAVSLLTDSPSSSSSTTDHIMVLHYARSTTA